MPYMSIEGSTSEPSTSGPCYRPMPAAQHPLRQGTQPDSRQSTVAASSFSLSLPSYRPDLYSVEFVTIVILLQTDRLMVGLINCGRKSFDLWTVPVVIPVVHSCRCSCSPGGAGHKVVDWALFWARLIEIQSVMINVEQGIASAQRS